MKIRALSSAGAQRGAEVRHRPGLALGAATLPGHLLEGESA
jgi:hypothetical protein